jgi:hypothetical protein
MANRMIRSLVRKLRKSIVIRGFIGTGLFVCSALVKQARIWSPSRLRAARAKRARELEFDRRFGVDTCGRIPLSSLEVEADNWMYGHRYEGSAVVDFRQLLDPCQIRYQDFTFVDFGSGKGRPILLASLLPLKKIVGVEFSRTLHEVASENFNRFASPDQRCTEIELRCMDVVEYPIPAGPLVLYFFNPFGEFVMQQVVDHVAESLRQHPRRVIVIYVTPLHAKLWGDSNLFDALTSNDSLRLYDNRQWLESLAGLASKSA